MSFGRQGSISSLPRGFQIYFLYDSLWIFSLRPFFVSKFNNPSTPDPLRGVLTMVMGIALFSVLNAVVKAQSETFPVNQIVFFRNAFAAIPLIWLLHRSGQWRAFRTARLGPHILLSLLFTLTLFLIFQAYSRLPLADATAIGFSQPLMVFVLASVLALERPNLIGWVAVGVGFIGILIMVRPNGAGPSEGYLFAVMGSAVGAVLMLVQRRLAQREPAVVIAFFTLGVSALMTAPSLLLAWVTPTLPEALGLVAMGLASGLCQLITTQAFFHASAALIAPVTYTKMLWAVLIGFVWFGDVPSSQILTGACIVILAAGLNLRAAKPAPKHLDTP